MIKKNHAYYQETEILTLLDVSAISEQFTLKESLNNIKVYNSNPLIKELYLLGFPIKSLNSRLMCGISKGYLILDCSKYGKHPINFKHDCNQSGCYRCSKKRQRRLMKRFLPYLNALEITREIKVRFFTISPEHYPTLEEAWKEAPKALKNFLRSKYAKKLIYGGLIIIQISEDGQGFHFHFHILVYSRYLDNKKPSEFEDSPLVKELKKSFKRNVIVNIKLPYSKSKTFESNNEAMLEYALYYASSLNNKFSSIKSFAKFIFLSHNRSLINTFGCFRKNPPKKPEKCCPMCGGYMREGKCKLYYNPKELSNLLYDEEIKPFFFNNPPPQKIVHIEILKPPEFSTQTFKYYYT